MHENLTAMSKSLNQILTHTLPKEELVAFLRKNPNLFDETIKISLGNKQPESWRAAWLLNNYMEHNDKRIQPHIDSILKVIPQKSDGHQREFLKVLMEMVLSEKQEGILFDRSISIWKDTSKSSSVRSIAFLCLSNTAKKYNELISEIEFLSQDHFINTLTPGIRSSVIRILKELNLKT